MVRTLNVSQSVISRLWARYRQTHYVDDRRRSGRPRATTTPGVITPNQIPLTTIVTYLQKRIQKQNFKPLGHYTCMQCGTSHLQTVQTVLQNILSHNDLQEVYSGNRQIHTKCQLQYLHTPQISRSGKCHCVIIHQTTKATECIG